MLLREEIKCYKILETFPGYTADSRSAAKGSLTPGLTIHQFLLKSCHVFETFYYLRDKNTGPKHNLLVESKKKIVYNF